MIIGHAARQDVDARVGAARSGDVRAPVRFVEVRAARGVRVEVEVEVVLHLLHRAVVAVLDEPDIQNKINIIFINYNQASTIHLLELT